MYTIPAKSEDPKPRMVRLVDPDEIAAVARADLRSPVGFEFHGAWFAESHSLASYRQQLVEFHL